MFLRAKDVARDAPVLVAATPSNFRQLSSPTLPSELVPQAACARASEVSRRVEESSLQFTKMNGTPR
jgi:hypothetical protein